MRGREISCVSQIFKRLIMCAFFCAFLNFFFLSWGIVWLLSVDESWFVSKAIKTASLNLSSRDPKTRNFAYESWSKNKKFYEQEY